MTKIDKLDNLFSADIRNQSNKEAKLANEITIKDLIEIGKQAEENNDIDEIEAAKLQKEIHNALYHGKIP